MARHHKWYMIAASYRSKLELHTLDEMHILAGLLKRMQYLKKSERQRGKVNPAIVRAEMIRTTDQPRSWQ
jgi:hypothetical protein